MAASKSGAKAVSFTEVSTEGLESSPVAKALAGLRANEARYFKNKYDHDFTTLPASKAKKIIDWIHGILESERQLAERFKFARQKSKLAGTIRGSFFVIKGEH